MKTRQRFFYRENGEKRHYLLLPFEYEQAIDRLKNFDDDLIKVAQWLGLSTGRIDKGTLRLQQTIVHIERD